MVRRVVVVLVAGVGLTVGASLDVAPQSSAQPVTFTGFVSIATSPDGRDTVVSIDVDTTGRATDGLVDHAFRLQHVPGPRYDYVGPASVTYDRHHVVVGVTDDTGWTFTVAGRPPLLVSQRPAYIALDVHGLSHHWGMTVQRPRDEVAAALMAGPGSFWNASSPHLRAVAVTVAGGPVTRLNRKGSGVSVSTKLIRMIWALVLVLIMAGAGLSTVAKGDPCEGGDGDKDKCCQKIGNTCGTIEDCGGFTSPCMCNLAGSCVQL